MSPNTAPPLIMHVDLNSCFATIEQQANKLLRGRAVAVSAYSTPRGMVLAASYEAKRQGIKLGVNNAEARAIDPKVVVLSPDPAKYREAHKRFKEVLLRYTDDVHPKSIDEFVLNFVGTPSIRGVAEYDALRRRMHEIGKQIKLDIKESLGEWVTVNIGIGPNRFLAKYAAGFNKPDGMTLIDHRNLRDKYKGMDLVDLPGINRRYKTRLQLGGVRTPLEFLDAPLPVLQKQIFKSIVGYYWYLRLRGHEIDNFESQRRSIGHQYALSKRTDNRELLARSLVKLCEKTGRRLRKNDLVAYGIHLYIGFDRHDMQIRNIGFEQMQQLRSWHRGVKLGYPLYATQDIYTAAKHLLDIAEIPAMVRILAITVFNLEPSDPEQLSLLDTERSFAAIKRISDAVDEINNRYGEFIVTPAIMMGMHGEILDRIAFGQVRDM